MKDKKKNAELSDADLDKVAGGTGDPDPYRQMLLWDIANERCTCGGSHEVEENPMTAQLKCQKCGKTWD